MAGDDGGREWRLAKRESWPTYCTRSLVYASGAVAGLIVLWTPVWLRAAVTIVALGADLIRTGSILSSGAYVENAARWSLDYMAMTWPFALGGMGVGLIMAWLRRHYGFYHRTVRWRSYAHRIRMPLLPHACVAIVAGPLFLTMMALATDPRIYLRLLSANFMLWAVSGIFAWVVWDWSQYALLRWRGRPLRRLDLEYAVRGLIEQDPTLAVCRVDEIAVDAADLSVRISGHFPSGPRPDETQRRVRELAHRIAGLGPVSIVETGPEPPPWWMPIAASLGRQGRFNRPA